MSTNGRRTGFSLVELLVVIGIIALLIGILLPSLARARAQALQVKSLSNMRQMLAGYTMYHEDNNGSLMLGYPPAVVNGKPLSVESETGHVFGALIAQRYPWRLAPYVQNIWAILHAHGDLPPEPQPGEAPGTAFTKAYMISLSPTYGLNTIFLGGHNGPVFSGYAGDRPNFGKHVVFKANQVTRATEVIVFADSKARGFSSSEDDGMHFLIPPRANGHRWVAERGKVKLLNPGMAVGIPEGRYGFGAVVGFLDGHAETMRPEQLQDMRYWAPFATTPDYDFTP